MDELDKQNSELQLVQDFQNVYSPSTLLGVFANAIKSPADGRLLLARGEYQAAQISKEYGGYYYDDIKSPNDNKFIKARIPAFLRSKLENQSIYIFKGYIEKRIGNSTIELIFVVDDILQKEEKQISEEDVKRFEVIQRKIAKGYKDFEAITKEHLYNNKLIRIANIYGTTAIVDNDFEKGLAEAKIRFDIKEFRCSLSSKTAIINLLRKLNTQEFDAIALVRGGGEPPNLEIFNDSEIGEETIKLKPLLITAIGHVVNDNLIDKIADKKFHLPHDYGNSLKVWVDEASEEQAKSKSLFIDQVKKDLTKTFEDQIKTKDEALKNLQKNYEETTKQKDEVLKNLQKTYEETTKQKDESLKNLQKNYEETSKQLVKMATAELQTKFDITKVENNRLNDQLKQASKTSRNLIIYLIIAAVIGLIVGLLIK